MTPVDVTVEELRFTGVTGATLAGALHRPADRAVGSVLLAHCFTCGKDLHTMTRLARRLAERGYAVLRFDFTGLGESGGDFGDTTVTTNVGDLTRGALALLDRGFGPCAMVGHSMGGAATLLAAHRIKTVSSVVVIGAPASPTHVLRHLVDHEPRIRRAGTAVVTIGGRPFPISTALLDDLGRHDQDQRVAELGRPLLVVHAVDDRVVPIAEGEKIFAAARQPKGFWPVPGADHLLSDPAATAWVGTVVADWLDGTRQGRG